MWLLVLVDLKGRLVPLGRLVRSERPERRARLGPERPGRPAFQALTALTVLTVRLEQRAYRVPLVLRGLDLQE